MISVIIPACEAEATLERALHSLLAQTIGDWEAIIISDDRQDYQAFLSGRGLVDARFRFGSTGQIRSGCHRARNVGFELVRGEYVTQLDADDEFTSGRLAQLLPLAKTHGAAADNLIMIDDATDAVIGTVRGEALDTAYFDVAGFMRLNAPLVPLVRRDHMLPRVVGVEFSEDAIANIQLIDQIGTLPVIAASSYRYRIRTSSMANEGGASERFERGYSDYIERLETGDGFDLSARGRQAALEGLINKRALNRAFMEAQKAQPGLGFQAFVGGL
jgi:glycosyltransferase involved in cell wall biosynthesis